MEMAQHHYRNASNIVERVTIVFLLTKVVKYSYVRLRVNSPLLLSDFNQN
jgi:hypothetical protein